MVKQLKKLDKNAWHLTYISTDTFNKMLEELGVGVRVIPRYEQLEAQYQMYLDRVKGEKTCNIPISKKMYDDRYFMCSCAFEYLVDDNIPSSIKISKALDVKHVDIRYSKNQFGQYTDNELEFAYKE